MHLDDAGEGAEGERRPLARGFLYRHGRLHELRVLLGVLPVRRDQDGPELRAVELRAAPDAHLQPAGPAGLERVLRPDAPGRVGERRRSDGARQGAEEAGSEVAEGVGPGAGGEAGRQAGGAEGRAGARGEGVRRRSMTSLYRKARGLAGRLVHGVRDARARRAVFADAASIAAYQDLLAGRI